MLKITNFIKSLIVLIRVINCLITAVTVTIAYYVCGGEGLSDQLIFAAISAFLTAAAGNVINDVADVATDKINRPDRPIPSGRIKLSEAKFIYLLLLFSAFVPAFLISFISGVIVLLTNTLLYLYALKLKRVPLAGNILIGILTGLAFFYGGLIGGVPEMAVIPSLIAGTINIIREVVKDLEDIEGDREAGIQTFPVKYGIHPAMLVVIGVTSLFSFISIYPFLTGIFNIYYLIILEIVIIPMLMRQLKILILDFNQTNLAATSRMLKIIIVIGILAIYAGQ